MGFISRVSVSLGLIALATACSSGGDGAEPRTGTLVLTTAEGALQTYEVASGESEPLLAPPTPGGRLLYPDISPAGDRIVYVAQPSLTAGSADAGMDVWIARRDGASASLVFQHTTQNQQVLYPQWQDEENLLAIVQEQGPGGIVFQLQRIEIGTAARSTLAEGIFAFAVSPDGATLAVSVLTDQGLALELRDADGGSPQPLLSPADGLSPYGFAQFSPDGTSIAFASAELPSARAAQRLISYGPNADGAPQDIWTADIAGTTPRRVAELLEDSPSLTWNGDGTRIYTQGAKGLFEVNLENGALTRLDDGVFHGHVAFAP